MLVLRTLKLGAAHGFGIAQSIGRRSDEVLLVEEGSLYPALHRLEQQGWISSEWTDSDTGRRAKIYSLTRTGRSHYARELESWERLSEAVNLVVRTV